MKTTRNQKRKQQREVLWVEYWDQAEVPVESVRITHQVQTKMVDTSTTSRLPVSFILTLYCGYAGTSVHQFSTPT